MKKVVHLTSAHQRYDQRILWRECCSLREHGYNITLIANDNQESETLENGIKILSTGFVPQGRRRRMTEGVERVYELGLAQDADIYHLHDPELLRIALQLKRHGKKVIFDSHELYGLQIRIKQYIPALARNLVANGYDFYESYVCRKIDGVIVPARYEGKEWFQGRAKRIAHVGNFPKQEEYKGISVPAYSTRSGVCYCGGLSASRGITNLVAAGKMAQEKVVLAGTFSPEKYKNEILTPVNSEDVEYLGYIHERRKIFSVYSRCAIGAAIHLGKGQYGKVDALPTKIYEYMAMEMPVILSDFPYRRKMIEKYRFGLTVDPSDVVEIAAKVKWLINHPKEAEEMGKNGKRLLEEQFTWEYRAEPELLRLYREIENET